MGKCWARFTLACHHLRVTRQNPRQAVVQRSPETTCSSNSGGRTTRQHPVRVWKKWWVTRWLMSVSNEQEKKQVTAVGKFILCYLSSLWEDVRTGVSRWSLGHFLISWVARVKVMPVFFDRTFDKKFPSGNIKNANLSLAVQRQLLKFRV